MHHQQQQKAFGGAVSHGCFGTSQSINGISQSVDVGTSSRQQPPPPPYPGTAHSVAQPQQQQLSVLTRPEQGVATAANDFGGLVANTTLPTSSSSPSGSAITVASAATMSTQSDHSLGTQRQGGGGAAPSPAPATANARPPTALSTVDGAAKLILPQAYTPLDLSEIDLSIHQPGLGNMMSSANGGNVVMDVQRQQQQKQILDALLGPLHPSLPTATPHHHSHSHSACGEHNPLAPFALCGGGALSYGIMNNDALSGGGGSSASSSANNKGQTCYLKVNPSAASSEPNLQSQQQQQPGPAASAQPSAPTTVTNNTSAMTSSSGANNNNTQSSQGGSLQADPLFHPNAPSVSVSVPVVTTLSSNTLSSAQLAPPSAMVSKVVGSVSPPTSQVTAAEDQLCYLRTVESFRQYFSKANAALQLRRTNFARLAPAHKELLGFDPDERIFGPYAVGIRENQRFLMSVCKSAKKLFKMYWPNAPLPRYFDHPDFAVAPGETNDDSDEDDEMDTDKRTVDGSDAVSRRSFSPGEARTHAGNDEQTNHAAHTCGSETAPPSCGGTPTPNQNFHNNDTDSRNTAAAKSASGLNNATAQQQQQQQYRTQQERYQLEANARRKNAANNATVGNTSNLSGSPNSSDSQQSATLNNNNNNNAHNHSQHNNTLNSDATSLSNATRSSYEEGLHVHSGASMSVTTGGSNGGPSANSLCYQQEDITPTATDVDKVFSTLRQCVRDWTSRGIEERNSVYNPILNLLANYFPTLEQRQCVNILVPGAGLSRLSVELAMMGFHAVGNEFSYHMLIAGHFIMNHTRSAGQFTLYPYVDTTLNLVQRSDQLTRADLPDLCTIERADDISRGSLSMVAGDFLEVYSRPSEHGQWTCVVSCFFLDTAHNVIDYLTTIYRVLTEGGLLINLGPLLYHFADSFTETSIELSLDELLFVAYRIGFVALSPVDLLPTTYTNNALSMKQMVYQSAFFVLQKPYSNANPLIAQQQQQQEGPQVQQ